MVKNNLLARFDTVPSLVAIDMRALFEASLIQASVTFERIQADTSKPKMSEDSDFWYAEDDWRSTYRPYNVRNGILQIPVKGVLLHDFPWQLGSWATGYDYIWQAFKRGMEDANVKGIALVIDSPGGEVAGNFDLVDRMFEMRGTKPVRAYASESAYSAAYSIASVADTITVSRTGGVGSIGVVTAHIDVSKAMGDAGYKITWIFAGKHKVDGNPYEPLPEDVKNRIQARIKELYSVFVSTVARNRGLEESAVRETEALTFTAAQATSNGLADFIGALDDSVAAFAAELSLDEKEETMSGQNTTTAPVDQAAAIETARTEGHAAGHTVGLSEGATAERARIAAILACDESAKRPKAAHNVAMKTAMSLDDARAFLADMPEENASAPVKTEPTGTNGANPEFIKQMNKGENANLGDPQGDDKNQVSRAQRAIASAFGKPKAA